MQFVVQHLSVGLSCIYIYLYRTWLWSVHVAQLWLLCVICYRCSLAYYMYYYGLVLHVTKGCMHSIDDIYIWFNCLSHIYIFCWTNIIIIIIIIKKDWQCKAGRGRLPPYQSEDPSPTLPTYRGKEEKGKIVEDKKVESN